MKKPGTTGFTAKELVAIFAQNTNEERAIAMSDYMRGLFPFYGLKKDDRVELWKPFMKQSALMDFAAAEKIIHKLWNEPHRECQYFAMEFALKFKKQWTKDALPLFEMMVQEKSWWDTVDYIAANLIGMYLKDHPEETPAAIKRWNKSGNMWLQRVSLIFQLKYRMETDTEILFDQCKKYAAEKDFFIRKAIGWALREYSKQNPAAVKQFISSVSLSPLSIKEGSKYI